MTGEHVVPIVVQDHIRSLPRDAHSMPVNLFFTDRYLVIHAGLPRCRPDKVQVFVAPGKVLIRAERHEGEPADEVRTYLLAELPYGTIGRVVELPAGNWAYSEAEAHFANGLLTVTIPTENRAEYLRQMHSTG